MKRLAPDLSWVYLEYTDEMGHRHGNGTYLTNAVLMLDKNWKTLERHPVPAKISTKNGRSILPPIMAGMKAAIIMAGKAPGKEQPDRHKREGTE
jgi:hypothetical protein